MKRRRFAISFQVVLSSLIIALSIMCSTQAEKQPVSNKLSPDVNYGLVLVPVEEFEEDFVLNERNRPKKDEDSILTKDVLRRAKRDLQQGQQQSQPQSNRSLNDIFKFEENDEDKEGNKGQKKYHRLAHSLYVHSDIRYRYATTLVTSEVKNTEDNSREVFLTAILPDTAFISRFAIEVGNQLYVAYVKEKEEAWKEYQEAVTKGKTAGHVGISARHSNHFRVSVNIKAGAKVTFFLLYEELLQRRAGIYEHVINLTPRQKLQFCGIRTRIFETANITYLHVPELRRHDLSHRESAPSALKEADVRRSEDGREAKITFTPDIEDLQRRLKTKHALQFVVEYDVAREGKGGDIQTLDGYFVHFVAPDNLPPMAKHVIFVLDLSGSMQGNKISQTRDAMRTILSELRNGKDMISIVTFSNNVTTWGFEDSVIVDVDKDSIYSAMDYVDKLEPSGGTNINDALLGAISLANHAKLRLKFKESRVQQMIIFLTDGHPTVGVTDSGEIMTNVGNANRGGGGGNDTEAGDPVAVFSLAFGRAADFELLKVMSLQNYGFARKIYVAADASLQLQGFYKEVSSPILKDVQFRYQDDEIMMKSLTSTNFHTYYQGSELVVAGKLFNGGIDGKNMADLIEYEILATQAEGQPYQIDGSYSFLDDNMYPEAITETVFEGILPQIRAANVNFLERLWAYLTIQDLLKKVARGELTSCQTEEVPEVPKRRKRNASKRFPKDLDERHRELLRLSLDDEDYGEGSGLYEYYDDYSYDEYEYETDLLETVGDADLIICNNLERALYLSLKYEFVTPLTSLVVVTPDVGESEGEFGDLEKAVNFLSTASRISVTTTFLMTTALIMLSIVTFFNRPLNIRF